MSFPLSPTDKLLTRAEITERLYPNGDFYQQYVAMLRICADAKRICEHFNGLFEQDPNLPTENQMQLHADLAHLDGEIAKLTDDM